MERFEMFSRFLISIIFAAAGLLSVVAVVEALEVGQAQPGTCSNGVHDSDETGVDCGGSCALTVGCVGNCTSAYIVDYCDGKDNDKDCLVDEDCKPSKHVVVAPQPIKGEPQASQEAKPSCFDGFKNQDELWDDCGGVCVTNATELCDGIDNDKDCLVDEGDACNPAPEPVSAPVQDCNNGVQDGDETGIDCGGQCILPTVVEDGCDGVDNNKDCEVDAVRGVGIMCKQTAEEPENVTQSALYTPVRLPSEELAPEFAQEAMAIGDVNVDSLTDEQLDAFVEQNGGAGFLKQMRKLADDKGIYVPNGESDVQFGRKYVKYFFQHQSELTAKFEGKEPSEDDFVALLKDFSSEVYPKPMQPQTQSFFSKVAGFFKRLFS